MSEKHTLVSSIVILGAGIGGLSTAIALKKQLGTVDFIIYEQASDVGGTWRDNTYPNCCSDIPIHWYSLSTDLKPDWTAYFSKQAEILNYWKDLVRKYKLGLHIVYGKRAEGADWDEMKQCYHLRLVDTATGVEETVITKCIVSCVGGFRCPSLPKDIPGIRDFAGDSFHSANWRHDISLKDKRVAVIGNGCSACQFVPVISEDASVSVVNFCRTPSWFAPRSNIIYSHAVRWTFAHVPFALRMYRNFLSLSLDFRFTLWQKSLLGFQKTVKKLLTKYIESTAPQEYHGFLVPSYPPGCKRIVVDDGYLACLHRPNVHLNVEGIEEIVPEGIKTKKGEIVPFDVIIFATGYETETYGIAVRGRTGTTIDEYNKTRGGPEAYLGTMVPGFPNYFTLMGPNTGTGHASIIFAEECQINYAIQLIRPVLEGIASSFEVSSKASESYNDMLQDRLQRTVWNDCRSYYRTNGGKNISMFPGPMALFWWWTRSPRWGDMVVVRAEKWQASRRRAQWRRAVQASLIVLAGILLVAPTTRASLIAWVLGCLRRAFIMVHGQ